MKKKTFYLGLTLLAPGAPQFALKRCIRGTIQLLAGLICSAWIAWDFIFPAYQGLSILLNNAESESVTIEFEWMRILILFICLVLFWTWSILDVVFLYTEENTEKEESK